MNEETLHVHEKCLCCEVSETMGRVFRAFGPSERVTSHFRQSRLEFLKGVRAALDERIEHMGRGEQKGTRVPVE